MGALWVASDHKIIKQQYEHWYLSNAAHCSGPAELVVPVWTCGLECFMERATTGNNLPSPAALPTMTRKAKLHLTHCLPHIHPPMFTLHTQHVTHHVLSKFMQCFRALDPPRLPCSHQQCLYLNAYHHKTLCLVQGPCRPHAAYHPYLLSPPLTLPLPPWNNNCLASQRSPQLSLPAGYTYCLVLLSAMGAGQAEDNFHPLSGNIHTSTEHVQMPDHVMTGVRPCEGQS